MQFTQRKIFVEKGPASNGLHRAPQWLEPALYDWSDHNSVPPMGSLYIGLDNIILGSGKGRHTISCTPVTTSDINSGQLLL